MGSISPLGVCIKNGYVLFNGIGSVAAVGRQDVTIGVINYIEATLRVRRMNTETLYVKRTNSVTLKIGGKRA